jgi:hypothetical protein
MNLIRMILTLAISLGLFFALGTYSSTHASTTVTINFSSDTNWGVYNSDPAAPGHAKFFGYAQYVCLNPIYPSTCPTNATLYGYPDWGWFANLSPISNSHWIWKPDVKGSTSPADLAQFYFSRRFLIPGMPKAGTLLIAADDFAEVRVNNASVGTIGSVTSISQARFAQNNLTEFNLKPFLKPGMNTVTVTGRNGPHEFAGCSSSCSYQQNPAGVVFGGSLSLDKIGWSLGPYGGASDMPAEVAASQ